MHHDTNMVAYAFSKCLSLAILNQFYLVGKILRAKSLIKTSPNFHSNYGFVRFQSFQEDKENAENYVQVMLLCLFSYFQYKQYLRIN